MDGPRCRVSKLESLLVDCSECVSVSGPSLIPGSSRRQLGSNLFSILFDFFLLFLYMRNEADDWLAFAVAALQLHDGLTPPALNPTDLPLVRPRHPN
jgi:hypothetical protein